MPVDFDFEREARTLARLATLLARNVVPLFSDLRGKPRLVGTGLLVSSGERSFLVSAAHVLDRPETARELYFYVEQRTRRKLSGRLRTTRRVPNEVRDANAPLDVGVLLLEGPGLPHTWGIDATAPP